MEVKEYQKAVTDFADKKANFEFTNKGKHHAEIVVANLIKTAEKELLIYSGSLNKDVANNSYLVKTLNQFLESGKKLRLIVDSLPPEQERSEALKQILVSENNPLRDVRIKEDIDQSFANKLSDMFSDKQAHHFMVADGRAYRLEIDAEEYKAICNFNDEKIASTLKNLIDQYFKKQ